MDVRFGQFIGGIEGLRRWFYRLSRGIDRLSIWLDRFCRKGRGLSGILLE
ncbi:hypothetical protein [Sporosarcina sp. USHLN248]